MIKDIHAQEHSCAIKGHTRQERLTYADVCQCMSYTHTRQEQLTYADVCQCMSYTHTRQERLTYADVCQCMSYTHTRQERLTYADVCQCMSYTRKTTLMCMSFDRATYTRQNTITLACMSLIIKESLCIRMCVCVKREGRERYNW
jgi:prophage antirepressor-like protein